MTTITRRSAVADGNPDAKIVELFRQYLDLVEYVNGGTLSDDAMNETGDQIYDVVMELFETPAETALGVLIKLRISSPSICVASELSPADEAIASGMIDRAGFGHALADLERMMGGLDHLRRIAGRTGA